MIVACGAVPVLGEIDSTLGLDPRSAEKLITEDRSSDAGAHVRGICRHGCVHGDKQDIRHTVMKMHGGRGRDLQGKVLGSIGKKD